MADLLDELRDRLRGRAAVVVGVGNRIKGDDAAGPLVVERLVDRTSAWLVDAGDVPENEVVRIADLDPEVVVVVDAADLGAEAGSLGLIEGEAFAAGSFSTHNPNLGPFAAFLGAAAACELFAVGIQPRTTAFDAPLSPEVEAAVDAIVEAVADALPPSS